jgi:glycosyltransferase involved in cell wall biosynthesis
LRVLVFTMVFPNTRQPLLGTFVLERVIRLGELADIQVIAPIAWFRAFDVRAINLNSAAILRVYHPKFWYVPKLLKYLRGVFLFLSAVGPISKARKTFDFDLIDAHFAYPDGFAAVLLGWWFRRPVCITLRGTIVQWSKRPIGKWICNWAINRADRVITVAENLSARAREGGVPEARITTIANGIDTQRFRLISAVAARGNLNLPAQGRLIVSVGHLSPRKGFHRVIRSLPSVLCHHPDARLVIVGGRGAEEDNSAALHALVGRLNIADKVRFVGAKPPDEVAVWLAASDVFVLASDFEGCPNVVLEAMACGRPVVATRVGDIGRMVPSFAGVLFDDPEDTAQLAGSLVAALSRNWDAEKIRAQVASRSWNDVAQHVLAVWRLAVKRASAGNLENSYIDWAGPGGVSDTKPQHQASETELRA